MAARIASQGRRDFHSSVAPKGLTAATPTRASQSGAFSGTFRSNTAKLPPAERALAPWAMTSLQSGTSDRAYGDDRVDSSGELELDSVGLHQADVCPAAGTYPALCLRQHRVGQVDANNLTLRSHSLLEERKVQAGAAADLNHSVPGAKSQRLYSFAPVEPLRIPDQVIEPGRDVVEPSPLPIGLDDVLSRAPGPVHVLLRHRLQYRLGGPQDSLSASRWG